MGAVHQASGTLGRLRIDTWRAAPEGEFVDGLVVTRRDTAESEVVRIAVFDPAENLTLQDHRGIAHRAVAVAARWLSSDLPALEAVRAANAELHDRELGNTMANPLVTAVWAELRAQDQSLQLLVAGRAGDGEVAVLRADGTLERLCSTPMWEPAAGRAWTAWVAANRPSPQELWAARPHWVGQRQQYINPPIGQFPDPTPETVPTIDLDPGDSIVVATDGAELDRIPHGARIDLDAHIAAIVERTPSHGGDIAGLYSHSDIAAVLVQLDLR